MKKISKSQYVIEYLLISFTGYLLISLIVAIIGDYNYRSVLTSYGQIYALIGIYWWLPIPRMIDLDNKVFYLIEKHKAVEFIYSYFDENNKGGFPHTACELYYFSNFILSEPEFKNYPESILKKHVDKIIKGESFDYMKFLIDL